jgi:hypothetical protein
VNYPDLVNGIFEFGIGLLALGSVRAIVRDKCVKGVYWPVTAWATAWGAFNLYYYPHLSQWFSFTGGLVIFATNTTWLALVAYYTRKDATAYARRVMERVKGIF